MNRFAIQTLLRPLMVRRLVRLLLYVLLILCLSTATLVVIEQQSPSRRVAVVPSSQAAWVTTASPMLGEGRI